MQIRKVLFFSFFFIAFVGFIKGQSYGNEWINYSKKYYKIKITKTGMYRVSYATLQSAGVPVGSVDPRNFQLFNNGQEQKVYVEGEGDGVFNSADFIEFYAEKNTGKNELNLYSNAGYVPNPYYSLINDTAVYFLTWNFSISNSRMTIETDVSFGSYTPDNYFFKEEIQAYAGAYYGGETNQSGGTTAQYVASEGYFDGSVLTLGNSIQKNISTPNVYTSGPFAQIETVVIGASKTYTSSNPLDHHLTIGYKPSAAGSFTTIKDFLFPGYATNKLLLNVAPSSLTSATTNVSFSSIADGGFISNRTVVSYLKIKYPHTLNMEGKSSFLMYVNDNTGQSKSYLKMSSLTVSGTVHLYNLSNGSRTTVIPNGGTYDVLIPNSGIEKKCYVTSDGYINNVASVTPVNSSGTFTNFLTLAADSAFVIVYPQLLRSSALAYASYRSSDVYGGLHNVLLADITELYDQFAYGIGKSPLSVRGFAHYIYDNFPTKPQNLLLLGKSIHMTSCRTNTTRYANSLVPSFGNPSSDPLLTAGINGTVFEPAIPIGRIAAKNDGEVLIYLNKVKEYENLSTNPPDEWKKQVLHFGGGNSDQEQSVFRGYLNRYEDTISSIYYGGNVTSYYKTSSAPIQINESDEIREYIDNGISLMSFFGHANNSTFDQNIGEINSYNPVKGRYPFMLALGCFVGDIHSVNSSSSSEAYILTDKGVIGYLGTLGQGISYALNAYSQEWYNQLARKSYGKSVGEIIQQTLKVLTPRALNDLHVATVCSEMTLHGDPSIRINTYQKPDYKITNSNVSFNDSVYVDSLVVNVVRTNLGKATNDTVFTSLTRTYPNGEVEEYLIRSQAPLYKDTVSFTVFIDVNKGIGTNKFVVALDAFSEVDELNENNNITGTIKFVIGGGGLAPIYPYKFAIVPNSTVTLKASTFDMFEPIKNYVFQIDTVDTFNSPFMQSQTVNAPGGVVSWEPSITLLDSTVYYWRVSPDSINAFGYIWKESSFQYIKDRKGWSQAHFHQFKPSNDKYQFIDYSRFQRKFNFENSIQSIACQNAIYPNAGIADIFWELNGFIKEKWHCNQLNPSITIAVIDPSDVSNLISPIVPGAVSSANNGIYGNCHCRSYREQQSLDYLVGSSAQRTILTDFINSANVPNGHYVLAYTMNYTALSSYENTLLQAFESFGSSAVRTLPSNVPYICFGRKGDPIGSAIEVVGSTVADVINLNANFNSTWTDGTISSPVIGPARRWDSFHWRQHSLDVLSSDDAISIEVIGIKTDGSETSIVTFPKDSIDVFNLANYVDVSIYPSIRLVAIMSDVTNNTPPQLDRWQVIYEPVPEGAINPPVGFYLSNDTLQEGESAVIHIPFQNVSDETFNDSIVFTYWVEDINGVITLLPHSMQKANLLPEEIVLDTIEVNTLNYPGISAIWTEVNAITHPRYQLEQYSFNNITRIPVVIEGDYTNPLLNVTFDGQHILNNDIVSAKPNILISLKDENLFLALNDTADFRVFIKSPSSGEEVRVYFGDEMTFTPAVLPKNSCKINYNPIFLEDGNYQLLVQAKDRSDNESGSIDYRINFEVINKSTITDVMNYPNPFSTSTRFVFTLTGSEIPTYFKVQIMTITGKVVREITQDELGSLHVGRNITDYAWNGKDEFGDQLANGVYLYRIATSINGRVIEKRVTEASQYFTKEFGKMYLMR